MWKFFRLLLEIFWYSHFNLLFLLLLLSFLRSSAISMGSLYTEKYIHGAWMTEMSVKFTVPHSINDSFPSAVSYTQLWFEPSGWRAKLKLSLYPAALVSLSTHVSPDTGFKFGEPHQIWECPHIWCWVGTPSLWWEWFICHCSFLTVPHCFSSFFWH